MAEEAANSGWVAARSTCLPGMLEDIYVQALEASKNVPDVTSPRKLTSIGVGSLVSLGWKSEHAATYQHFVGEGRRVSLLMAGLPFNISALLQDKTVSFLRRAPRQRIGRVTDVEVELAFAKTVRAGGRDIERDALGKAVAAIAGLPFMLQLVGYRSWEVRPEADLITTSDVQEGVRIACMELRDQVLESTYRELSDGDVLFLVAMLPDDGDSRMANIARRLGKSSGYVNSYRRRMLQLGVIGERRRGVVGLDLPGFADFLAERASEDGLL